MNRSGQTAGASESPMMDSTTHDHCLREIQRLKEENELLRRSARSFGELAERLHLELERQRWHASDCAALQSPLTDLTAQRPAVRRTSLPR